MLKSSSVNQHTSQGEQMLARAQLRIISIASLAGLLFGFDTAVIAGVTQALRAAFGLSPAALGLAVSAALWGTLLGAIAAGRPGDQFGARTVLRFIGLLYAVSALGCALSWSLPSFIVFRFLTGVAIGASSVLAPVYIAEVAPAPKRGALVGLFQINIVIGILLAYVSNFAVAQLIGGEQLWRWKLGMAAIPACAFLLLLLTIPHSPRWLLSKGRVSQAVDSFLRLGFADPQRVAQETQDASRRGGENLGERLSFALHRRPILLAIGLGLFNQLTGINAILYYLGDIFGAAGFSSMSSDLQSVAIGLTNFVATLFGMSLIDRLGRRQLLLIGSVGMALSQGGVAFVMSAHAAQGLLLPLLVLFIASFAVSQGAVIWVYLSEIFPTAVRARGQALGSATHWVANALISAVFPAVAAVSRPAPFAFFAVMMVVQLVLVLRFLPETRGVRLEDMQQALGAGVPSAEIGNMRQTSSNN
jgi:sugar porter (SP) family MFS transporter